MDHIILIEESYIENFAKADQIEKFLSGFSLLMQQYFEIRKQIEFEKKKRNKIFTNKILNLQQFIQIC